MIRLWGLPQRALYQAARHWRDQLRAAWPAAEADAGYDIHFVAGAEGPGAPPRPLDLVVAGCLAVPQLVPAVFGVDGPTGESALDLAPVYVGSFCAVVTVAAVPPAQVEWRGDHVGVVETAGGPWRDLLEHSRTQRLLLRAALEAELAVPAPILHRHLSIAALIWLPAVVPDDMLERFPPPWLHDPQAERADPNSPILRRNLLYGDATWPAFLGKVWRHWPEQHDFPQTHTLRVLPAPYEPEFRRVFAAFAGRAPA